MSVCNKPQDVECIHNTQMTGLFWDYSNPTCCASTNDFVSLQANWLCLTWLTRTQDEHLLCSDYFYIRVIISTQGFSPDHRASNFDSPFNCVVPGQVLNNCDWLQGPARPRVTWNSCRLHAGRLQASAGSRCQVQYTYTCFSLTITLLDQGSQNSIHYAGIYGILTNARNQQKTELIMWDGYSIHESKCSVQVDFNQCPAYHISRKQSNTIPTTTTFV